MEIDLHSEESKRPTLNVQRPTSKSEKVALLLLFPNRGSYSACIGCGF